MISLLSTVYVLACGYIFMFVFKGSRGVQGKQGFPGAQGREVRAQHQFV